MLDSVRAFWLRMKEPAPQRLADFSPMWSMFQDPKAGYGVAVGFDLRLTTAVTLAGVDTACEANGWVSMLSKNLADALTSLRSDIVVRFWSYEILSNHGALKRYAEQFNTSFEGSIARQRAELCSQKVAPRQRRLLVTVSTKPHFSKLPYSASALGALEKLVVPKARSILADRLQELRSVSGQFCGALHGAGLGVRRLSKDEFYAALWQLANPMRAAWQPRAPKLRNGMSLRTQLFCSGLLNDADYMTREDHYHRVVSLKLPPESVWPECIEAVQGFDFPHVLNVTVRRADTDKAVRRLGQRASGSFEMRKAMDKIRGVEKNAELADTHLLGQQHSALALLEAMKAGDAPCDVAVQLCLSAHDRESLSRHTETVLSAFRSQAFGRAEACIEEYRTREAFLGMLPGHEALIGDRYSTMLASRAADLLPVFATAAGASNPSYYLTTRERTLYGFDAFDPHRRAHNMLVTGGTGVGKSVAVRALLQGHIGRGGRVIVITRGTDYHRFSELLEGSTQDISLEDPDLALGPFASAKDIKPETSSGRTQMAHLANVVGVMATESDETLTRNVRSVIFRALKTLYRNHCVDTAPTFADYIDVLRQMQVDEPESHADIATLITKLRYWTNGAYAHAFTKNRRPVESRLSVWNLEPIEQKELHGTVLALLSGVIARSVSLEPTIVVLDECWSILSTPAGANLVQTLYRTVRKMGSSVWGISQSIEDFLGLPADARSGIMNNSPLRIYAKTDNEDEVQKIAKVFNLSDRATDAVRGLKWEKGKYADLLIEDSGRKRVVQLIPTGIELWMMTSEPKDLELERRARAKHPNEPLRRIVRSLGRHFPYGAAHGRQPVAH